MNDRLTKEPFELQIWKIDYKLPSNHVPCEILLKVNIFIRPHTINQSGLGLKTLAAKVLGHDDQSNDFRNSRNLIIKNVTSAAIYQSTYKKAFFVYTA